MARIPGVRADSHAAWLWLVAIVLASAATWLWGRRPAAAPTNPSVETEVVPDDTASRGVQDDDFVELEAVEAQFGLDPIEESGAPSEPQTTE